MTNFKLKKKITRYKSIFPIGDKLFNFMQDLTKAKSIIENPDIEYPGIDLQKLNFIRSHNKILKKFLFILPLIFVSFRLIYRSMIIEKIFNFIGKYFKFEHERSLYIFQKR